MATRWGLTAGGKIAYSFSADESIRGHNAECCHCAGGSPFIEIHPPDGPGQSALSSHLVNLGSAPPTENEAWVAFVTDLLAPFETVPLFLEEGGTALKTLPGGTGYTTHMRLEYVDKPGDYFRFKLVEYSRSDVNGGATTFYDASGGVLTRVSGAYQGISDLLIGGQPRREGLVAAPIARQSPASGTCELHFSLASQTLYEVASNTLELNGWWFPRLFSDTGSSVYSYGFGSLPGPGSGGSYVVTPVVEPRLFHSPTINSSPSVAPTGMRSRVSWPRAILSQPHPLAPGDVASDYYDDPIVEFSEA